MLSVQPYRDATRSKTHCGNVSLLACRGIGKGIAIGFAEEGVRLRIHLLCTCAYKVNTHLARCIPGWWRIVYHRRKPVPLCEERGAPRPSGRGVQEEWCRERHHYVGV